MTKPCVLVLMGGPDAEREVSLDSGRAVAAALEATGDFEVREAVIDTVNAKAMQVLADPDDVHVIFPVLHGTWGEGGPLQEVLDTHGLPYVGSGARASALAMDKLATKSVVASGGIATPLARRLESSEPCGLEPPLVLKPVDDGSSVDLRICRTVTEIESARRELHPRRGPLLAERYIAGRELTVGIVGGETLPIIEIIPAVEFYDYEAKYERYDTQYRVEPRLPSGIAAKCRAASLYAYRHLGCRDLARVDFMLDDDDAWFLELNTMPGFTSHSLLPMAARRRGWEMPELCNRLARTALERGETHIVQAPPGFEI